MELLDNLKSSLEHKGTAPIKFVSDQSEHLAKLKNKVTIKLIEAIIQQIKEIDEDSQYYEIVSNSFVEFIKKRAPIMA